MSTRITVNGREYASIDEMPPDVREQYRRAMNLLADRDGNGVPDILERGGVNVTSDGRAVNVSSVVSSRIVVNGQEYTRWDDVPADVRAAMQRAGVKPNALQASASSSQFVSEDPPGGLTIRVSWSTILTLLVAATVTLVAWLIYRG